VKYKADPNIKDKVKIKKTEYMLKNIKVGKKTKAINNPKERGNNNRK